MTDDKLYTSPPANTIMAKHTNHVRRTRFITSSTDKHYPLDSEDEFRLRWLPRVIVKHPPYRARVRKGNVVNPSLSFPRGDLPE